MAFWQGGLCHRGLLSGHPTVIISRQEWIFILEHLRKEKEFLFKRNTGSQNINFHLIQATPVRYQPSIQKFIVWINLAIS